eukprot:scaffold110195_cov23-Tisochrysis_lutea.AAC.1
MEVPGSMLLRDPKGNVYAIQTEALQQVRGCVCDEFGVDALIFPTFCVMARDVGPFVLHATHLYVTVRGVDAFFILRCPSGHIFNTALSCAIACDVDAFVFRPFDIVARE